MSHGLNSANRPSRATARPQSTGRPRPPLLGLPPFSLVVRWANLSMSRSSGRDVTFRVLGCSICMTFCSLVSIHFGPLGCMNVLPMGSFNLLLRLIAVFPCSLGCKETPVEASAPPSSATSSRPGAQTATPRGVRNWQRPPPGPPSARRKVPSCLGEGR